MAALIPARTGSKRVPGKNTRPLGGHPMVGYTIAAALQSGVFADVIVSTDDESTAAIARRYGAEVPFLRPAQFATDASPDIEWVEYTLDRLEREGRSFDAFGILRPTSPFRRAETIQRAWAQFAPRRDADSLRAVEKCAQHPGKMWVMDGDGDLIEPLLDDHGARPPWHSSPYQSLPPVYVQNASLEIAWTDTVRRHHSIAGTRIVPFLTQDHEGFDINDQHDWWLAEELLRRGEATLPTLEQAPQHT